MEEEEKVREVLEFINKIWREIESEFYPELDEAIELFNLVQKIKEKSFQEVIGEIESFLMNFISMQPEEYRRQTISQFNQIIRRQ
jgi:DNA-binding ferritin-like protein (Dps family)